MSWQVALGVAGVVTLVYVWSMTPTWAHLLRRRRRKK